MIIREACIENNCGLEEILARGVERIELCDNLAQGGTSVSIGVAKFVTSFCHKNDTRVMAMVRPRGGDFVYSECEVQMMCEDIVHYKDVGVDGVVFGCTTFDGKLDKEAILRLVKWANGLEITFHMAFDNLNDDEKLPAIDWLAKNGVTRILTHGGELTVSVENVILRWKEYVDYAKGKLIIIPGGGVTKDNYERIVRETGATEVHGTKII